MKYKVVGDKVTLAAGQVLAGLSEKQISRRRHLLDEGEKKGQFVCKSDVQFKRGEELVLLGDAIPRAVEIGLEEVKAKKKPKKNASSKVAPISKDEDRKSNDPASDQNAGGTSDPATQAGAN